MSERKETVTDEMLQARMVLTDIFLLQSRGNGKTHVLITGLSNVDRPTVCLVHSEKMAKYLQTKVKNPLVRYVAALDLKSIRSTGVPIVADHESIGWLISRAF